MKLTQISEDAKKDISTYKKAQYLWNDLLTQITNLFKENDMHHFEAFEKTYADFIQYLPKRPFRIDIDLDDNKYFWVYFKVTDTRARGRFLTKSIGSEIYSQNEIVLYVFNNEYNSDMKLISFNDFLNEFSQTYKTAFIHEVVHYLDASRVNDKKSYLNMKKKQKAKGEYINTPHEYNAFYMQLMSEIEELFKTSPEFQKEMADVRSFKDFKDALVMMVPSYPFIRDNLDSKYTKAFYKRLYGYYNQIMDK